MISVLSILTGYAALLALHPVFGAAGIALHLYIMARAARK